MVSPTLKILVFSLVILLYCLKFLKKDLAEMQQEPIAEQFYDILLQLLLIQHAVRNLHGNQDPSALGT